MSALYWVVSAPAIAVPARQSFVPAPENNPLKIG
jgi:hypothetical protein